MKADEAVYTRGPHGWLEARGWKRPHLVALVAGVIANLGFAPLYFFPAWAGAMIALVWLLDGAARREKPMRAAFLRTLTFALSYFGCGFYWVMFAFFDVEGAAPLAPLALLVLAGAVALFWAVSAAIAIKFWSAGPRRIALFALMVMAAEWGRGHAFGGFPWNLPGYVWPAGGEISQAASFGGIYGLSALTVLVMAAPATLADAGKFGFRFAPSVVAAVALGMLWGGGAQRLSSPPQPPTALVVRVADAGFTQTEKWKRGNEALVFRKYVDLIDGPSPSKADIDIWPESAMPFLLLEQPDALEEIGAHLGDRVLVTGTSRAEQRGKKALYFNSAVVLDGVGGTLRVGQIYNKSRLVPGGEFIPLWSSIEGIASGLHLTALQQIGSGFEPGEPPTRIVIPGAPDAAVMVCYEAIFPGFAPRGPDRPAWLINVSNDAWFSSEAWPFSLLTNGPRQHFNQARYRAIEEGLPLARAASGGVSAMVDPYGRVLASTGLHGGAVEAPLPAPLSETFFSSHPNATTLIVFLILAALGIALPGGRAQVRSE